MEATEQLSESYHDTFQVGLLDGPRRGKRTEPPVDLHEVRKAAEGRAAGLAQEIITLAQAEALELVGERDRGLDLVEERLL